MNLVFPTANSKLRGGTSCRFSVQTVNYPTQLIFLWSPANTHIWSTVTQVNGSRLHLLHRLWPLEFGWFHTNPRKDLNSTRKEELLFLRWFISFCVLQHDSIPDVHWIIFSIWRSVSGALASVLGLNMVHVIYILYKPCWRDSACACVHKHTIADAHFQLRNGLFYTGIGKSLIADWLTSVLMWIDTALWEQVRGKASFFFPLSLFCAVAFCQGEMPGCLPDRSVSPSQMLMWLQGLWMGNETRALSEDPVLHLLSPLSQSLR